MNEFILNKELYDYDLPKDLIGSSPKTKRDESRLFVFNTKTGEIIFDIFKNIDKYLPKDSVLVLNETKVVPARVNLIKNTKGRVETLFLIDEWKKGDLVIKGIVDREVRVGDKLYLGDKRYFFEVIDQDKNTFSFRILFSFSKLMFLFEKYGKTPIPKYIKGIDLTENNLRKRYQSIFAKKASSVAAPTASLHFTKSVFNKIKKHNIKVEKIVLNVGLGTFKPISKENVKENKLHKESFNIPLSVARNILRYKVKNKNIITVGTTTLRALESWGIDLKYDLLQNLSGKTDIFIHPPFDFKITDCLITNFHLPNSSLMMLVEAFLQYKKSPKHLIDLYKKAIEERFRFYSFGDAMLIL